MVNQRWERFEKQGGYVQRDRVEAGPEGLRLDLKENNSKTIENVGKMDCSSVYLRGVDDHAEREVFYKVPCKQWSCSKCRPNNAKKLKQRAVLGLQNELDQLIASQKGFRVKYCLKILTLTCPGKEYRSASESLVPRPGYTGNVTIQDAHRDIKKKWNNLRSVLDKRLGTNFKYFLVVEPQMDGYPHLHILLLGPAIAGRKVLNIVREFWAGKYGMGSQLDIQAIKYGVKGGVSYVTKYLAKGAWPVGMPKGSRYYSASRGLLMPYPRSQTITWYEYGKIVYDDAGSKCFEPIMGLSDISGAIDVAGKPDRSQVLQELSDYFDLQSKLFFNRIPSEQMELF